MHSYLRLPALARTVAVVCSAPGGDPARREASELAALALSAQLPGRVPVRGGQDAGDGGGHRAHAALHRAPARLPVQGWLVQQQRRRCSRRVAARCVLCDL